LVQEIYRNAGSLTTTESSTLVHPEEEP